MAEVNLQTEEREWYYKDWAIVIMLIIAFPIGLIAAYKSPYKFPKKKFFIGLGVFVLYCFAMGSGYDGPGSGGPAGKSWDYNSENGAWETYNLGDRDGHGSDYLNYNAQTVDAYGSPAGHIHRTGTFTVSGKTINCKFNDGQPPYKLRYKKTDGVWTVVDDYGHAFYHHEPK